MDDVTAAAAAAVASLPQLHRTAPGPIKRPHWNGDEG